MFLWLSSTKIVQAIWIRQKNMAARGQGLFSLYIYVEKFKNLLVRNQWTNFNMNLQKCTSTKIVQAIWIRQKTWPSGGGAYFPYKSI